MKNKNGITLIALIITIIIMLVLVGVTVSFVSNGGLISKAKQAAKQTQIAADKELLEFDVVLAVQPDGSISFSEFKTAAQSDGFTVSGSSLPCTATSRNGNEFSISVDGKVTYTGEVEVPSESEEDAELELLRKYFVGKLLTSLIEDMEVQDPRDAVFVDGTGDASSVRGEDLTCLASGNDSGVLYLYVRYEVSGKNYKVIVEANSNGVTAISVEPYNGTIDLGNGSDSASESSSDSSSDSESSSGSEPAGRVDYNNNPITLGSNVSVVPYENLTGGIKQGVDNGKVTAVLTESINGVDTIAVIPTGFTISSTSGENTISGGLVVRDNSNNEFVWIPVPNISSMAVETEANSGNYRGVLYDWETDSTGQTAYSWSSDSMGYREPANLTGTPYEINYAYDSQEAFTENGGGTYTSSMYQTEFNSMVESVGKYKGFYVGRYETGGFNGSTIVVKAGETDYSINRATWYKVYQMQKDFASSNANVASTMIWGCQWDQVMKFVDDKEDETGYIFNVTTYRPSRHKHSLAPTGNNIKDKVQNIYDLEGNVFEWTLEACDTESRVLRGGDYDERLSCKAAYYQTPAVDIRDTERVRKPRYTLYKVMLYAERN